MAEEIKFPDYNTGLIQELSANAWLSGDKIPYKVVLESADYRPFAPVHEKQKDPVECYGCVSFSLNNNIEIQHNLKGINVNLSDKFLAKVSGTTKNGNSFERVADAARHIGVVFESDWPNSPKAKTFEEYYKTIPSEVMAKAIKLDFNYEMIPRTTDWAETLRKNLKQCPLWITWPADPYHAVTLLYVYPDNIHADVQDHYSYQIRRIKVSDIARAARVVINQYLNMNQAKVVKSKVDGSIYVAYEMPNMEYLKTKANIEGFVIPDPIPDTDSLK